MSNIYLNTEEFKTLVNSMYEMILNELNESTDFEVSYPKAVYMYEFFRLLRGEAFTHMHEPLGDYQKEVYKMEDTILKLLLKMKNKIDSKSDRALYNINEATSFFQLN